MPTSDTLTTYATDTVPYRLGVISGRCNAPITNFGTLAVSEKSRRPGPSFSRSRLFVLGFGAAFGCFRLGSHHLSSASFLEGGVVTPGCEAAAKEVPPGLGDSRGPINLTSPRGADSPLLTAFFSRL